MPPTEPDECNPTWWNDLHTDDHELVLNWLAGGDLQNENHAPANQNESFSTHQYESSNQNLSENDLNQNQNFSTDDQSQIPLQSSHETTKNANHYIPIPSKCRCKNSLKDYKNEPFTEELIFCKVCGEQANWWYYQCKECNSKAYKSGGK